MESKNKVKKFINKMIFLIVCIVLSIAFSFGLKTYIDYQGVRINEEEPLGAPYYCSAGTYPSGGECKTCPAGSYCTGGLYVSAKKQLCSDGKTSNSGSTKSSDCYCPSGKYMDNGTCTTCPAGSKCDGKNKTACGVGEYQPRTGQSACLKCGKGTYQNMTGQRFCQACKSERYEYQDLTGQSSCKTCAGTVDAGATSCKVEQKCTVNVTTGRQTVTIGESYNVNVSVSSACNGKILSFSVQNGTTSAPNSITINGSFGFSYNVTPIESCQNSSFSARVSNTSDRVNVNVRPTWTKTSGNWSIDNSKVQSAPHSRADAEARNIDHYYSSLGKCSNSPEKICYREYWSRGCDGGPATQLPEIEACYKNNKTGEYTWGKHNNDSNYTKLDLTKEECVTPKDVDVCIESEIVAPSSTKNAVCNGDVSFNASDSKSCTVNASESDFYKITCTENLQTKLNPSEMTTIKLGLGFKYNIDITTTRVCKGVFDSEKFNDAYKKINDNLRLLDAGSKDYQTNLNKKNDLEKILKNYNDWKSNYEFDDIKATLKDNQLNTTINFIEKTDSKKIVKGTKYEVKKHNLNISGISNPIDFRYEETLSKTMILPMAYYNINNKVVYNNCTNCIKLSNQYYISDNSKYSNTDYKYTVNVTGLGYNKNWSVKTTDCSLKVISDKSIYRPTDVNDPFLNDANPERETGKNWLSDTMDFTGIIKSDTWKQKSLYEFNITGKNVKAIRNNNHELGANAYIGTDCKLITTTNRYYCSFLRNSMYFQYHYIYTDELR